MINKKKNNFINILILIIINLLIFAYLTNSSPLANLYIPWGFEGDGLPYYNGAKSVHESPWWYWFFFSKNTGFPFETDFTNLYPNLDLTNLLIIKLLNLIIPGNNYYIATINLFEILKHILISISAFFLFKIFSRDKQVCIFLSLLYAFTYTTNSRGIGHLFIGAYFSLPIILIIIYQIFAFYEKNNCSFFSNKNNKYLSIFLLIMICLSSGLYYSYIFLVSILVLAIYKTIERKFYVLKDFIIISLFSGSYIFLINSINILFGKKIYQRTNVETDMWGLKLADLLLPHSEKINSIGFSMRKIFSNSYVTTEPMNSFGTIGLIITFVVFYKIYVKFNNQITINNQINISNTVILEKYKFFLISLFAFVFFISFTGSFSYIQSVIFPAIRAQNRFSIFLFLIILNLFIILISLKYFKNKFKIILLILLFFHIYELKNINNFDKPKLRYGLEYNENKNIFNKFIKNEDKILIWPILPSYPEQSAINSANPYELLKPYIYTNHNAKFSYPIVKNTYQEDYFFFLKELYRKNQIEFFNEIKIRGFTKIIIDKKFKLYFNLSDKYVEKLANNERYEIIKLKDFDPGYKLTFNANSIFPQSIIITKDDFIVPRYLNSLMINNIIKKNKNIKKINLDKRFHINSFERFNDKVLEKENMKIDIKCSYDKKNNIILNIHNKSTKKIIFNSGIKYPIKIRSYYTNDLNIKEEEGPIIINEKISLDPNENIKYETQFNIDFIKNQKNKNIKNFIIEPVQEDFAWFSQINKENKLCQLSTQ